ncbi:unnamed protein product [Acanthoscelides obtectus]|uniref:Uncharacterized protein n=1 Tax=Acanthoscelides obtectus TaxID=200917 RepID=A0A9P0Q291_ACAOB|nr:unnamed protein product [Acanthoscelides obtectus]CAK1655659.1 hypothetical protein AOBTE_LOCUS19242 [Acanthoscelides obtectus]
MIIIEHHLPRVDSRDLACSSISLVVAEISKSRALLRLLRQ